MLAEANIVDRGLTLTDVTPYLCPCNGEKYASMYPVPDRHCQTLTRLSLEEYRKVRIDQIHLGKKFFHVFTNHEFFIITFLPGSSY